ncbi:MAG: hypothetical protein J7J28_01210 [Thaumarchaeota archaeon]|nr:hypothetical protein [Nitrososphaerota archaeon]
MGALIALLDGAADELIPALANKTPLEAAGKPFIDRLASSGLVGYTGAYLHTHQFLADLLAEGGQVPRGILEALALDIPLREGMIVYRLSPARIDGGSIELEYNLSKGMLQSLESLVNKMLPLISDLSPRIYFNDGRGILILEKTDFKPVSSSPFEDSGLDALPIMLQDFVRRIALRNNGLTIIPWGGGVFKNLNLRPRVRRLSILSNSPAAHGLAKLLKIKAHNISSLDDLLNQARRLVKEGNVLIHFERPDMESHKRSYTGKVSAIEEADHILEELYRETGCRILLVIDHGTSSMTGRHFRVKTPFLYAEKPAEEVSRRFHEKILGEFVPTGRLLNMISK